VKSFSYSIYGITLESKIAFPNLSETERRRTAREIRISFGKRNFRSSVPSGHWQAYQGFDYWLSPSDDFALVRSRMTGTFRVNFHKRRIDWKPGRKESLDLVRTLVSGRILGLLLPYLEHCLPLHASTVVLNRQSIGFLGPRGGGKSTLAASFLKKGSNLLSDDIAIIQKRGRRFLVQRGPAEIRLWPNVARQLKNQRFKGAPVYPGTVKERISLVSEGPPYDVQNTAPLASLYLLSRRRKGPVRIENLRGQNALAGILRNVYNPMVKDPNVLREQFEIATQLIQTVPVKRLIYPTGLRHLARVRQAVLSDLRRVSGNPRGPG